MICEVSLHFVLGHKCALKSVEQLCTGELLKTQLQQLTAFVRLIYVVLHGHPHFLHHPASSAAVDFRETAVLEDKPKAILQSRSFTLL